MVIRSTTHYAIQWNHFSIISLFLLKIFVTSSFTDQVAQFTYTGHIEDLKDSTITVNEKMVALTDYVFVKSSDGMDVSSEASSILFVIDHSSSMFSAGPQGNASDIQGTRFTVPRALIDSIYAKNPKIQIGLIIFQGSLYFETKNDQIMQQCPQDAIGAYIPLLQLDSTYNGKKGIDILKFWLETEENTTMGPAFTDLKNKKYDMTVMMSIIGGTNITLAFDAAKHAMTTSKYSKNRQFIIYLSDGEATYPEDLTKKMEYVQGKDVPTTFTVFFTEKDTTVASIQKMTDNIKKNGFSSSNPMSNMWSIKTEQNKLMNLLITNVISKIIVKKNTKTPFTLAVNNINPSGPYDSKGFPFAEKFPMNIFQTTYHYSLSYKIKKDSITVNDTISVLKDTTSKFPVKIVVQNGADNLNNKFKVDFWERSLSMYHGNNIINTLKSTMNEAEIRFTEKKVDILYDYKDVCVEISALNATTSDKELFTLTKKGDNFSHIFKINHNAPPASNDGIIQISTGDKLLCSFRNKKLPRDTLVLNINYDLVNTIEFKNALYFDTDAEGYVDSIFIETTGEIQENDIDQIKQHIKLPQSRKFTLVSLKKDPHGIALRVRQDHSVQPQTFVNEQDKLSIDKIILSPESMIKECVISIQDRIAPIIHWAEQSVVCFDYLDPNKSDSLFVTFSEDVRDIEKNKPFYFLTIMSQNKTYVADLAQTSRKENTVTFKMKALSDDITSVRDGDSIWIHEGNCVSDGVPSSNNYQNNPNNSKRRVSVKQFIPEIVLVPNAVNPYDVTELRKRHVIPDRLLNLFIQKGKLNSLALKKIDDKYVGMIITVEPKHKTQLHENFLLTGDISIFDALGNCVLHRHEMVFNKTDKSLYYIWNASNTQRLIGKGDYFALFTVVPRPGGEKYKAAPLQTLKLMLGVKQ